MSLLFQRTDLLSVRFLLKKPLQYMLTKCNFEIYLKYFCVIDDAIIISSEKSFPKLNKYAQFLTIL